MSFAEPSPERRPVKITYTSKSRRRDSVGQKENELVVSDNASENEEPEVEVQQEKPVKISALETSPGKPDSSDSTRSNVTKRPFIEPLNLPGPTPRHKRDSSKFEFPADGANNINKHAKSSSGDVFFIPHEGTPRISNKPISSLSAKLASSVNASKRAGTPDSTFFGGTETASVTSTPDKSRKITRMTEAERINYFRSDPNAGGVEPHRIFCKVCGKWLVLHAKHRYVISHWKDHRTRCVGTPVYDTPRKEPNNEMEPDDDEAVSVIHSVTASETISIATSQPINTPRTRRNLEERKQYLEADALIDQLLPNEVHCAQCNTWIKLSTKTQYALTKWMKHVERIHGGVGLTGEDGIRQEIPSRRVQEAQARLQIVNDSQAGEFATNWILCKICTMRIPLSDKLNFELTNWVRHKEEGCSGEAGKKLLSQQDLSSSSARTRVAAQQSPKRSTTSTGLEREKKIDNDTPDILPSTPSTRTPAEYKVITNTTRPIAPAARSSPSTATDSTVVGSSSSSTNTTSTTEKRFFRPLSFLKRKREDDVDIIDKSLEEQRPSVKPRTESYKPPNGDQEPPRPWGWLLYPWDSFKRGFLEGLWANGDGPISN